jgi:hypothetical protein
MIENRVLQGYQGEARGRGESEAFWPHSPPSAQRDLFEMAAYSSCQGVYALSRSIVGFKDVVIDNLAFLLV